MNLSVSLIDKLRLPLLHKLYKANYPVGKPKGKEDIIILEENSRIIGSMRVKHYESCDFLTGMMLIETKRGKKLGNYLLQFLPNYMNTQYCYCFCDPSLSGFYLKNHFSLEECSSLPHVIQQKHKRYTNQGKKLEVLLYKK